MGKDQNSFFFDRRISFFGLICTESHIGNLTTQMHFASSWNSGQVLLIGCGAAEISRLERPRFEPHFATILDRATWQAARVDSSSCGFHVTAPRVACHRGTSSQRRTAAHAGDSVASRAEALKAVPRTDARGGRPTPTADALKTRARELARALCLLTRKTRPRARGVCATRGTRTRATTTTLGEKVGGRENTTDSDCALFF